MKTVAFIPARYGSSRFTGKPLADICGKPMIWWVFQQAKKVAEIDEVFVATDDERIKTVCDNLGMNVVMTSTNHSTGTDRVCEAAKYVEADIVLNIQGDEPLIEPSVIKEAITPLLLDNSLSITNLMTAIESPIDVVNFTVPKVVTNENNDAVYLSRSPIPYPKGSLDYKYFKQVCVYGFRKDALKFFETSKRGKLEEIEDIEILRFIEGNFRVKYVEVKSESIAVDTKNDLKRVIEYLNRNPHLNIILT